MQDPSYPVYVDSSVMFGRTGEINDETKQYADMVYMPCVAENGFFPDLEPAKDCQIIMFCNPNNPTGACATREQLQARTLPCPCPLSCCWSCCRLSCCCWSTAVPGLCCTTI